MHHGLGYLVNVIYFFILIIFVFFTTIEQYQ
jgi:hypothetical protein